MPFVLPQFQRNPSYAGRDNYRCSELQYSIPIAPERNRPTANNLFGETARRFNLPKFRPDRVVTTGLLSQPSRTIWIALRVRQRFPELRIAVVNRPANKQELLFSIALVPLS